MKITIILIFWITTVNARSRSSSSSRTSSKSRSRSTTELNNNLKHDSSIETKPNSISNPINNLSSSRKLKTKRRHPCTGYLTDKDNPCCKTVTNYHMIDSQRMVNSRGEISEVSFEQAAINLRNLNEFERKEIERCKLKSTRKKEPQEKPDIIRISYGAKSKIKKKKKNFRKIHMAIKKKHDAIPKTESTDCKTMSIAKTSNSLDFNENWFPRSSNINLKISLVLIVIIFL